MMMDDNEYGMIGGTFARGNQSTRRKPVPCHIVHHKFHMSIPGLKPGRPWWEAGDKIMALYIPIITFLDSGRENKRFCTEW
jgi:hypothetical protein